MSDLISRSALIKTMNESKKQPTSDENIEGYCEGWNDLADIINEQPTAYDVEKVVTELEKLPNREADYYYANSNDVIDREDAIEIVKQSGVSDDVCEWRLCDEEANVYDTSCRNPHILIEGTPKENNYEYCPYCGKKIKVVE